MDDIQTGQPAPDTGAGDTAAGGTSAPVCEHCGSEDHPTDKHPQEGGDTGATEQSGAQPGEQPQGGGEQPQGQ